MRHRNRKLARALVIRPRYSVVVALAATCRLRQRAQQRAVQEQFKPQDYSGRRLVVLLIRYLAIPPPVQLGPQHLYRQHLHLRSPLETPLQPRLALLLRILSALALALVAEFSEPIQANRVGCLDKSKDSKRN